jgi:hypothetical protein
LTAHISDHQSNYAVTIVVNPDGSSQAAPETQAAFPEAHPAVHPRQLPGHSPASSGNRPAPTLASSSLPAPFDAQLRNVQSEVVAGRAAEAAVHADRIIQQLSDAFGSRHPFALAAGIVRGDIALMTHDYRYGLSIWLYLSHAWHDVVGPDQQTITPLVLNAVWCWSQLPERAALEQQRAIVDLLQRVRIPGGDYLIHNVNWRCERIVAGRKQPR